MKKKIAENRKLKRRRIIAAAGAGLTAAAVLITTVLSRPIDAQAAGTLMGIERLRSNVKESGSEYVVLEVVPDGRASEIGYLFDGYEPILSEWDEETGEWKSWRDVLCEIETYEHRADFIRNKKEELQAYYDRAELTSSVPVVIEKGDYEENPDGKSASGYEEITASGYRKTGWFTLKKDGDTKTKYLVAFHHDGIYDKSAQGTDIFDLKNTQYYVVSSDYEITDENEGNIPDDALVYHKIEGNDKIFEYAGKWIDVKESVTVFLNNLPIGPSDSLGQDSTDADPDADTDTDSDEDSTEDDTDPDDPNTPDSDDPNEPTEPDPDEPNDPNDPDDPNKPEGPGGDSTEEGTDEDPAEEGAVVTSNAQINFGRWFLLSGEEPDNPNESLEPDNPSEPTEPEDPNEPAEPEDPDEPTNPEIPDDPVDPSDTPDAEEPKQDSDNNSSHAAISGVQTYDPSGESEFKEGYYIVTFERVPGNQLENYNESQLYSVIESTIEANVNGDYVFEETTSDNEEEEGEGDSESDGSNDAEQTDTFRGQTYTFPGRTIYCKNTFKTNEWFRQYVIDMDQGTYTDFPVKVISLTPEQLNTMYKAGGIPKFDFLYLSSGLGTADEQEEEPKEEDSKKEGEEDDDDSDNEDDDDPDNESDDDDSDDQKADTPRSTYVDAGNDLSSEVLQYLYATVIGGTKPCLVDGSILYAQGEDITDGDSGGTVVNETLQKTNIFRLSAMLCQEDFGGNYDGLNNDRLVAGIVNDADKNFVVAHVYCRYGNDSIINSLFSTPTIYTEGGDMSPGFQSVLDEILLENQYRDADSSGNYGQLSTDISQATALRHILNYADRRQVETKKHIRVLEIQPAMADESEITLAKLQEWAPGVESAEITVMTTAEFIGKIEKLNENYDLIYIGTSKDHLNMRYWYPSAPDYKGKPDSNHIPAGTAFNDSDMDGLIYYNIGDLRGVSMQLAGQLDSEYVNNDRNNNVYYYNYTRYGGNDITEEKMKALFSFLDGSYPVIVADDFFELPVTVYATPGYKDGRVSLSEGEYDYDRMHSLGIGTGDISSVKVKEGYRVTFYNNYYLKESSNPDDNMYSLPFERDESDFNNFKFPGWGSRNGTWNNMPNSFKIERISEEVPPRTIDEDHIDNCTYMYEFVKGAMEKKYVNFYAWSDITPDSELFKFYLNRPKVSMTQSSVNGLRKEGSDIYYVEAGANGRYNLEYHFTIHNEGAASFNSRYECKLYIDINSDGKFSPQEEVGDISLSQGGGYVSWDNLYADREYVLKREVPAGYKGLLPWRVEVTQADNPNIYTSISGYSKLEGVEQEKITVLQITRARGGELLDLNREIETEGTIYNALVHGGTYDGVTYEGIDDDFDIDVTFMTVPEYENEYWQNNDYLDDFNMLILGFDDLYDNIAGADTWGPMGAIVDFINSGKSVLLSHDTTSYSQFNWGMNAMQGYIKRDGSAGTAGASDNPFAYSMNQYVRPLVGMDRYGILTSGILKAGNPLTENSAGFAEVIGRRYDKAYKPKSGKTQLVPQVHGYTYIVVSGKDFDVSKDRYDKGTFTKWELDLSQADDWTFTNKYTNIRYDDVYYNNFTDRGELSHRYNSFGEISKLWVTQVNQGQITEYPYKLLPEFEIAETHGQYYQLDYTADDDGDGESDLVVWFCLDKKGVEGQENTVYSQSPNDVRNNYYIYNKGNITYTGMGHSAQRDPVYTLDEAKLFINTMIAAYQAGIKDPYVTVLKKGVPESEELTTLYRFYDRTNNMHLENLANKETYEKIYFTVQDINFIKGSRTIASRIYYTTGDQNGTDVITVGGEEIIVHPLVDEQGNTRIYHASDGALVDADNLRSGGIYYIMVPKSVMEDCEEGLDIYFEAQSTLTTSTTNPNVYVTNKVYAKLQVLQAYMFNLE